MQLDNGVNGVNGVYSGFSSEAQNKSGIPRIKQRATEARQR